MLLHQVNLHLFLLQGLAFLCAFSHHDATPDILDASLRRLCVSIHKTLSSNELYMDATSAASQQSPEKLEDPMGLFRKTRPPSLLDENEREQFEKKYQRPPEPLEDGLKTLASSLVNASIKISSLSFDKERFDWIYRPDRLSAKEFCPMR